MNYIFSLPYFLYLAIFVITPLVLTFVYSTFTIPFIGLGDPRFVGSQNFADMFNDQILGISLKNMLYYIAILIPIYILVSLALALVLLQVGKGRRIFLAFLLVPYIVANPISCAAWSSILFPNYGIWSTAARYLGFGQINFLSRDFVIPSLCILESWSVIGYLTMILMGGLAAIPREYYDAAKIDGAGRLYTFRHITLPLLKPIFFFVFFISSLWAISITQVIMLLTGGGPGYASYSILYLVYTAGFKSHRLGYAFSILVPFSLGTLALYFVQRKVVGGFQSAY